LIISWVTSTGSLHSPKASLTFVLSFSMSSKRISSTMGPSRLGLPARGPGLLLLPRRPGCTEDAGAWRPPVASATVLGVTSPPDVGREHARAIDRDHRR